MAQRLKFNIIVFSWPKWTVFIVFYPAENFCDCRLLCLRSGMNVANLSTRMEMRSAEVKYCKLSVLQAFLKDRESNRRAKMSLKKDDASSLLQMQFLSLGIKDPFCYWVPTWQMFQVRKAFSYS